jgi:hypothetical protein
MQRAARLDAPYQIVLANAYSERNGNLREKEVVSGSYPESLRQLTMQIFVGLNRHRVVLTPKASPAVCAFAYRESLRCSLNSGKWSPGAQAAKESI